MDILFKTQTKLNLLRINDIIAEIESNIEPLKIQSEKAKQFLSDGLSVTAAAEAAGFSDIYYFSNVFKRLEGISPKKFKTNLQKEQSQA